MSLKKEQSPQDDITEHVVDHAVIEVMHFLGIPVIFVVAVGIAFFELFFVIPGAAMFFMSLLQAPCLFLIPFTVWLFAVAALFTGVFLLKKGKGLGWLVFTIGTLPLGLIFILRDFVNWTMQVCTGAPGL